MSNSVMETKTVTLAGARRVAEAAVAAADAEDARIVVVVVNATGGVVVVHRMDEVVELAVDNATAKARAALTFRRSTAELSDYFQRDRSLGPPMTARSGILAVEGGELLMTDEGAIVGALGISGSHHSVDQRIAAAGVQALFAASGDRTASV